MEKKSKINWFIYQMRPKWALLGRVFIYLLGLNSRMRGRRMQMCGAATEMGR